MKTIVIFALALTACSTFAWKDPASPEQLSKIKNYHTCQTDFDCKTGQVCSFAYVDTYAVCR